jgi:EAL domain-containing protein (putative c-di-GMP-specific phosphodiesterase class I)
MTNTNTQIKLPLVEDLRLALMTQQFHMVFQPKVCARTNQIVGAEVLLRWQHPTHGLIPADHWVSLAESHNLIRPLTLWLLDKVICHLKSQENLAIPLAINVPPTCLDGAFVLHVVDSLTRAGVAYELLEIEITESTPVENMTNLANSVRLLRAKGVKVYLDDFGTGYSTMQYLVEIPVDGVKMDKSFVQQAPVIPAARMVLRSLIELTQEIGATVVCEGVETAEQLMLVKQMGAKIIQGYIVGKPMAPKLFSEIMTYPVPVVSEIAVPALYESHYEAQVS